MLLVQLNTCADNYSKLIPKYRTLATYLDCLLLVSFGYIPIVAYYLQGQGKISTGNLVTRHFTARAEMFSWYKNTLQGKVDEL